ncbi:MAG: hypothetical protein K0S81_2684 [Rhodospirillales bacterium]|nr:hypothetical protein [Rhodospirillales bacterium]
MLRSGNACFTALMTSSVVIRPSRTACPDWTSSPFACTSSAMGRRSLIMDCPRLAHMERSRRARWKHGLRSAELTSLRREAGVVPRALPKLIAPSRREARKVIMGGADRRRRWRGTAVMSRRPRTSHGRATAAATRRRPRRGALCSTVPLKALVSSARSPPQRGIGIRCYFRGMLPIRFGENSMCLRRIVGDDALLLVRVVAGNDGARRLVGP